jgi:hypothetical protein
MDFDIRVLRSDLRRMRAPGVAHPMENAKPRSSFHALRLWRRPS